MVSPTASAAAKRVVRIVSKCSSEDEFASLFARFVDRESIFIVTRKPKPVGAKSQFFITLADGAPVLSGRGEVIETVTGKSGKFKRPGMRIKFEKLEPDSKKLLERMTSGSNGQPPPLPPLPKHLRPRPPSSAVTPESAEKAASEEAKAAAKSSDGAKKEDEDERAPHSETVLPANPFGELTDDALTAFIECTMYEESGAVQLPETDEAGDAAASPSNGQSGDLLPAWWPRSDEDLKTPPPAAAPGAEAPSAFASATPGPGAVPQQGSAVPQPQPGPDGPQQQSGGVPRPGPGGAPQPGSNGAPLAEPGGPQPGPGGPLAGPGGPLAGPGGPQPGPGGPQPGPGGPQPGQPPRAPTLPPGGGKAYGQAGPGGYGGPAPANRGEPTELVGRPLMMPSRSGVSTKQLAIVAVIASLLSLGIGYAIWGGSSNSDDSKPAPTKPKGATKPDTDTKPDTKADDTKADDTKADDTKADDTKADDTKADDTKADDTKADDTKTDDTKTDDTPVAAGDCRLELSTNAVNGVLRNHGKSLGRTPYKGPIPCGTASLLIKHPRYRDGVRKLRVKPGSVTKIHMKLSRPTYRLLVISSPRGGVVYVNGHRVGKAPVYVRLPGYEKHRVVVRRRGYKRWYRRIYLNHRLQRLRARLRR